MAGDLTVRNIKVTDRIEPGSAGGTVTLGNSINADTIAVPSGVTLNINSGATFSATSGTMSGQNYPAFQANMSGNAGNQTISNTTETVLNFVTKEFDTDNAYDTTNKRFNPQVSGKYYIYASARWADTADWDPSYIKIRKNGSTQILAIWWRNEYVEGNYIGAMVDMNGSSDYVDIVVYQGSGSGKSIEDDLGNNIFGGYRIGA